MSVHFDFSGKKVLVTGASKGIGRAICVALVDCGATVFGLARDTEALAQLEREKNVTPIVCDLTSSAENIKKIVEPFFPFDYLVNNAGVAENELVGNITAEAIDRTFAVNFRGPVLLSQVVAESMAHSNIKGSIVNISSQASQRPLEAHTVYCSSKAALDMATRCLASELGPRGIRVNSVNPTVVLTEMGRQAWGDKRKAEDMLNQMSIKQFAVEEDVVLAVLFLLCDATQMTTGLPFTVDGGFCYK